MHYKSSFNGWKDGRKEGRVWKEKNVTLDRKTSHKGQFFEIEKLFTWKLNK